MPAFTLVAGYIVAGVIGIGGAAILGSVGVALVTGAVAAGLAMITSRIINGSPSDGGGGGGGGEVSQGTRIQLPPATNNRVPVIYGRAFTSPIISDAYLDNENKTMTYVLLLSETSNIAGYTCNINNIYWNDLRLEFDTTDASKAVRGKKRVDASAGQPEDFTDSNFDGFVWFNIWRWDALTQAPVQIFGKTQSPSEVINKYTAHWDTTYKMEGLVFAVLQMNYDQTKGFSGLPQLTFEVATNISNPALVLLDYMCSDRFGAGIRPEHIDYKSFMEYRIFCDALVPWTPIDATVASTAIRYQINGIIDTSKQTKTNIDSLCLSGGAWISYDIQSGQWRIIPKAIAATSYIFSDDDIVSGINLSSTRLDDLYNIVEATYFDTNNRDQQAYAKINLLDIRPDLLNRFEHENTMSLSLEFCNNNVQAERIADMELEQCRDDLVVSFSTSHVGLQLQAGDVIGINNPIYGWDAASGFEEGKLFRIIKITERETAEGGLGTEITGLEYNPLVYDDKNIKEFYCRENLGVPSVGGDDVLPPPSVEIVQIINNGSIPSFTIKVTTPDTPGSGPFTSVEVWYAEGNDYAGRGGDFSFTGQIRNGTLTATGLGTYTSAPHFWLNTPSLGLSTEVTWSDDSGVEHKSIVADFMGNTGGNGSYGVDWAGANVSVRPMTATLNAATFNGYISGDTLTITHMITGQIAIPSLTKAPGIIMGTEIIGFQTGVGGVGTYKLNFGQTLGASDNLIYFEMKNHFPDSNGSSYKKLTTIDQFDQGVLNRNETREIAITGLPANAINSKYFLRARVVQTSDAGTRYGVFSDLGTVDLETVAVFWDPDASLAKTQLLNMKTAILRLDFGKLVIPNNGYWLMKTMAAIDFGELTSPSTSQLDLGYTSIVENIVALEDDFENFVWQDDPETL
jgi:hypothetical protein